MMTPPRVVTSACSLGTGGDGGYLGAFLAAALLGLYLFYGFEACGDVAEEVPDTGRTIPKAMRRTIYIGAFAGLLITAALILAQPDFDEWIVVIGCAIVLGTGLLYMLLD